MDTGKMYPEESKEMNSEELVNYLVPFNKKIAIPLFLYCLAEIIRKKMSENRIQIVGEEGTYRKRVQIDNIYANITDTEVEIRAYITIKTKFGKWEIVYEREREISCDFDINTHRLIKTGEKVKYESLEVTFETDDNLYRFLKDNFDLDEEEDDIQFISKKWYREEATGVDKISGRFGVSEFIGVIKELTEYLFPDKY